MKNSVEFMVSGRYALFTDPLTRLGGEKYSYQIPTYEAIKGVLSSIYWKPTFTWVVDKVRVMNAIRSQPRSAKPVNYSDGEKNGLAIYTYLYDVTYQVLAHFEWNEHRADLIEDRQPNKHLCIAERMIKRGGRRDVFLGTRECQAYVEPAVFGTGEGQYDNYIGEMSFGLMFHGFDYPDELGTNQFCARFWHATMEKGVIKFIKPHECTIRKCIRKMRANPPNLGESELLEACEGEIL